MTVLRGEEGDQSYLLSSAFQEILLQNKKEEIFAHF